MTAPTATSISALATLRDHALPATLGKVSGISYAVTGNTASTHDFSDRMHAGRRSCSRSCSGWRSCC